MVAMLYNLVFWDYVGAKLFSKVKTGTLNNGEFNRSSLKSLLASHDIKFDRDLAIRLMEIGSKRL